MKNQVLKLSFVLVVWMIAVNSYSSNSDATIVAEENFSAFTEGSVDEPGSTDISSYLSGKLGQILSGWRGSRVYEAGGCLFVKLGGNLQTASYSLSENGGVFRLTFRVRGTSEEGNSIAYQVGYNPSVTIPLDGKEWQTVSVLSEKGSYSSYIRFTSPDNGFYVDDLKVETSPSFIIPPVAKQPTQADDTSFTATWTGPSGITGFILEVYTKEEHGEKDYFLQEELSSAIKTRKVTGLSSGKTYFYTVKAKNANGTSEASNEIEVIKVIDIVEIPVALAATDITPEGFTAHWETNGKPDLFALTLMSTETLPEAKIAPVISEDFSGVQKGSLSSIVYGSTGYESLDLYTRQSGWGVVAGCYAAGYVGVAPISGKTGAIQTPLMDLSSNNGAFSVDLSVAEIKIGGTVVTGGSIELVLCDKEKAEKEKKTVSLSENRFAGYTVNFASGTAGCYLEVRYTGANKLFVDEFAVKQRKEAGTQLTSVVETVETKQTSHTFSLAFKEGFTFSYYVNAKIRTVDAYGTIIMLRSGASQTIEIRSPAAGDQVVVAEDFSAFDEGSEQEPGKTDISTSKLPDFLPGWRGSKLFEAGGSLFLGENGFLQTASYNLTGNNGIFKVSFRAKALPGNTASVTCLVSGITEWQNRLTGSEWETITFISENGNAATDFRILSATGGVLVDDLKIESNHRFIKAPVANQPTQADGNSFTASWSASKAATAYLLDVYTLPAEESKEYFLQEELERGVRTKEVTGLDPGKNYYYSVRAKKETEVSDFSNEIEVIRVVTSLEAPVAKKATQVTQSGFTANWEKQPAAEFYTVILSSKETTAVEGGGRTVVETVETKNLSHHFAAEASPGILYSYQVKANVRTVNEKGEIVGLSSPLSEVIEVDGPVATVTTILDEGFAAFSSGSESKPSATDISGSKLPGSLPGWSGKKVYEAGGTLYINLPGFLQTASYDLSGNEGIFKVTFRVKAAESYGNMIQCSVSGLSAEQLIVEDADWHTVSFISENGKIGSYLKFSSFLGAFFIDDLKIETSSSFIKAPVANQPEKADRVSFTASWTGAKNATGYELDVYTKGEDEAKEYFLQEELPSDVKTKDVTGLTPGKTYFYTVRAKNAEATSGYSEEIEVVRVVKSLPAPVAKAATDIDSNGFTANWEKSDDTDYYTVWLIGIETLLETKEVSMLAEDFSGIKKGTFSNVEYGRLQEYLDEFTKVPGWFAVEDCYAEGHIGLAPFSAGASLTTPEIDLSQGGGAFSVALTMAEMRGAAFVKEATVTFTLYDGDEEVEKQIVNLTEEKFADFNIAFTKGNKHASVGIKYAGKNHLFIDRISVNQVLNRGDKVSTLLKTEETEAQSVRLEAGERKEFTFGYQVTASVRTVDEEGKIYLLTSAPSEKIEAVSYVAIKDIRDVPYTLYTGNGEIVVVLRNEEQIAVYDTGGRLVTTRNGQAGANPIPVGKGLYMVRIGNELFKVILY